MFLLEDYTDQELLSILRCNRLSDLHDVLDEDKAKSLIATINDLPSIQTIPSKSTQALLVPITDTSSIPFILLGSMLGMVGGTLLLFLCTLITLCSSLALVGYFFYTNLYEIQKKETKINRLLHLYQLKNQAADLFIKRKELAIEILDEPTYTDKHRLTTTKEALRACMVISTTLFGTYFLGLKAILSALGFSLITTSFGPIGVFLGIGIALGVGIYFGYKHYQMLQKEDYFKFQQKYQAVIVGKKTSICQKISTNTLKNECIGELQKTKPVYATKKNKDQNIFSFRLNQLTLLKSPNTDASHSENSLDVAAQVNIR